jgi:hypothetical protein
VTLCPTPTEPEGLAPRTVNPAPEIAAREMFAVAVPVFVRLRLCVELLPTATFPKLMLTELALRTPAPADCVAAVCAALV